MGLLRSTALSGTILAVLWASACKTSGDAGAAEAKGGSDNINGVTGIDVSKYQGQVDFVEVKQAGISFVFIKATQGITYQDALFSDDFDAATQAGLAVGAYHFYMTDDDPQAQFENYATVVSLAKGNLPPVVDIESLSADTRPDLASDLHIFLDLLERQYGAKPILYSGQNFANQYLNGFGGYPLWLAEYGVAEPNLPDGWPDWTFWQWTDRAAVDGMEGDVDGDRYNGDLASFQAFLLK